MTDNRNIEDSEIDRVERLINRRLDGANTPAEEQELDSILACSENARALWNEYSHLDQFAANVLRSDAAQGRQPPVQTRLSFRLAIAGALLSAAAVIAFAILPELHRANSTNSQLARNSPPHSSGPIVQQPAAGEFVDYRPSDFLPLQRQRGLQRDVIGVRGDDPNVIYVFEKNTKSTRLVPITGEF